MSTRFTSTFEMTPSSLSTFTKEATQRYSTSAQLITRCPGPLWQFIKTPTNRSCIFLFMQSLTGPTLEPRAIRRQPQNSRSLDNYRRGPNHWLGPLDDSGQDPSIDWWFQQWDQEQLQILIFFFIDEILPLTKMRFQPLTWWGWCSMQKNMWYIKPHKLIVV